MGGSDDRAEGRASGRRRGRKGKCCEGGARGRAAGWRGVRSRLVGRGARELATGGREGASKSACAGFLVFQRECLVIWVFRFVVRVRLVPMEAGGRVLGCWG